VRARALSLSATRGANNTQPRRAGTSHGLIRVFTRELDLVGELRGHDRLVRDLAFTRDGACLVSASWDGAVRVWRDGACERVIDWRSGRLQALALAADALAAVSLREANEVRVVSLDGGAEVMTVMADGPFLVALAPDARAHAAASAGRLVLYFSENAEPHVLSRVVVPWRASER